MTNFISKMTARSLPKTAEVNALAPYPWLRACLEDYTLAILLSEQPNGLRHSVCLMHDAIEFLLYEILLHLDHDIYNDGQHTIGFDGALTVCEALHVGIPLLGTVRAIQKQRGDAKHHAQRPDEKEFRRIVREFQIIISRLIHERFAESLGDTVRKLELIRYHQGLFETYRKYRTHRWGAAQRAAIGAVLHKHRELLNLPEEYDSMRSEDPFKLLAAFEKDIRGATYPVAREEILKIVRGSAQSLRQFLEERDERSAAEYAGRVYVQIDEILPSSFDIMSARRMSPRLVQPSDGVRKDSGTSKWQSNETAETSHYKAKIAELLRKHPSFVNWFGMPFYMEDDDRYWKWWEFAIFDGEQWTAFDLHDDFEVSLESQAFDEEGAQRRERQAKLVFEEFAEAMAKPEFLNSPKVTGVIQI